MSPDHSHTHNTNPTEGTWEAQILSGRFRVSGMGQAYDACVGYRLIDSLGFEMAARGLVGPVALVSDENAGKYHTERAAAAISAAGYGVQSIIVPAGERHKTLHTVEQIWVGLLAAGIERDGTVVALGGGVVGDLAGFAAATWQRGVAWVNVPTTLLAMCDASIGGKTGADLPEGKNLIGAFHSPALVLADLAALATLPEAEIRNGLAEVIIHAVIGDASLLELIGLEPPGAGWKALVSRAMAVKIKIIQEDPYEQGPRQALNLGHTIGHAVELVSGFQQKHGEAVAIGLVAEARIAEMLGIANPQDHLAARLAEICRSVGLPTEIPSGLDRQAIHQAIYLDKKKAAGRVRFALPAEIGQVVTGVEVSDTFIHEVLAQAA
ncbi:MAG: 3-dehydroquinate synthase [Chloroflexota bacterium]